MNNGSTSGPSTVERLRDAGVRLIDKNPALSRQARHLYKVAKRTFLQARALGHFAQRGTDVQNVYHASIQRTGSRWVRRVFSDPRVKRHSGLLVYPQHEYQLGDYHKSFPPSTFVPGLYISYEKYFRIKKPNTYRTIYVLRDPRNVTLSWYKSMRYTHKPVNDSVLYYRKILSDMGRRKAITKAIELYQNKISYMKDWFMNAKKDDEVLFVKFENMISNSLEVFSNIMNHCKINIPRKELKETLKYNDKARMRKKDKRRRVGEKSDYSKSGTNWRDEFEHEHIEKFKSVNGKVVDILNYEW